MVTKFLCFSFFLIILTQSHSVLVLAQAELNYPNYEKNRERNVCLKQIKKQNKIFLQVRSEAPDESCEQTEKNFQFISPAQMNGSFALVPKNNFETERNKYWPPLHSQWPVSSYENSARLWHFSCLSAYFIEVLGMKVEQQKMLGSITLPAENQTCETASESAQKLCQEKWKGTSLLEQCGELLIQESEH